MALEKWLLDLAEFTEEKTICQFCEYLLRKSASAAITAVVLSVVIAYPDKLFPISCILLKTKEVFVFDIARLQAEHSADFPFTEPARLIAPPYSRNFSVSVVLPASGWEMMAKVRRLSISFV